MSVQQSLLNLKLHAENLTACRTFEEYQRCHIAWIEMMVAEHEARLAQEKAVREFVDKTDFVTKIKYAIQARPVPCVDCGSPVASVGDTCGNCGTIRAAPAADDARTDPVQDERAERRAADLTPSQQAKLDLAKGQSDAIKTACDAKPICPGCGANDPAGCQMHPCGWVQSNG